MAKAGYVCATSADVNFSTAKSIVGIKSHANFGMDLIEAAVAFQGTSATAEPVTVELCYCTWATNSPGTNSTSETLQQLYGRVITVGATGGRAWSSEPTTVTMLKSLFIHPQAGLIVQIPLGTGYDCAVSEGFVIRCTAASAVDARAWLAFERC